jgi:hypothetical protein
MNICRKYGRASQVAAAYSRFCNLHRDWRGTISPTMRIADAFCMLTFQADELVDLVARFNVLGIEARIIQPECL